MPPEHLRILRHESSASLRGIVEQKDHLKHQSPLAVVDDSPSNRHRRKTSWSKSFTKLPFIVSLKSPGSTPSSPAKRLPIPSQFTGSDGLVATPLQMDDGVEADNDGEGEDFVPLSETEKTISERVQYWNPVSGAFVSTYTLNVN